jgi:hypothetical protein
VTQVDFDKLCGYPQSSSENSTAESPSSFGTNRIIHKACFLSQVLILGFKHLNVLPHALNLLLHLLLQANSVPLDIL